MNRTIHITLIALLLIAGTASAQVTFQAAGIAAQTSWSETASYASNINTRAGESAAAGVTSSVSHDKSCTVLEIDHAGRIATMRVTYGSASNAAVAGRSYIVTPQEVRYAAGGTPSDAERRFVRGDNSGFSQFRALERIFGGRTVAIGQSFQPNKNDAEELVNVAAGTRLRSMALTLRSVANGVATFDLSMTMESDPKEKKSGKAANGQMTLTLDGELAVTVATSRPVRLEASGALQARTKKADGSRIGDATGEVTMRRAYAF